MTFLRMISYGCLILLLMAVAGCGSKNPPVVTTPSAPPITPTPPAPAPTITLRADPATIDRGGSLTLQWEARNAASVSITPGVGDVPVTGNRSVSPPSSVTYQATAGPGGSASDIARVTVNIPAAPPADTTPRTPTVTGSDLGADKALRDVLFDYDSAEIRSDMVTVLMGNAGWLKTNPNVRFTIEGHCDERGSEEYNLGLGDRRANAVREFMVNQGVAANRMTTLSYGEARPSCRDESEECFARNRRAHFAADSR
jgi:peptidoglycan-associated lipoprotein